MVSITGFGILPLINRSHVQPSDASQTTAQPLNASDASDASDATDAIVSPASPSDTGANAPTSVPAAPRLSADVVGVLISNQARQSTDRASSVAGSSPAPNSDTSKAVTSSAPPSAPPTLQQIAAQFDIHHLTHQQEAELGGQLISSGSLSHYEGARLFATTVLADDFNSQHYRIINGQLVATTPSPPGELIGAGGPAGGPQYDIVQRVQQALLSDQYFGDTQNAAKDQNILNVLNQLDKIRHGGTA
jgi:hypothetical protein